ncbi:MAG: hypothetical protein EYC62_03555 [Alphaproteobacteria bacterium]|nr:MAG: hypothetical protein EYC62_03555 [Alphaproteobacteria bacterium]
MMARTPKKKTGKKTGKKPAPKIKSKSISLHKSKVPVKIELPSLNSILEETTEHAGPVRIADISGNILYKNRTYKEEIEGGALEPDAPDLIEIIQQLEMLNNALSFDLRVNREGKVYVYRTTHRMVALSRTTARGVISQFLDVTGEEHIKSRLQLTQSRLDDVIRLSSDWVWETDDQLRLTVTSQRIYELLGFHPREIIGCGLFSLGNVNANEMDTVTGKPIAVQRLTPFRNLSFYVTDRVGKIHTLQLSGMPNFDRLDGKFLGYRGTARDISDELTAKSQAELLERRLGHAIETMSEGFALFDKNGHLILINGMIRNFFNATEHLLKQGLHHTEWLQQAVLRHDVDTGGMSAQDWINTRNRHFIQTGAPFEFKLADGRYLLARDYKTEEDGRVSIFTDITEIKHRENELTGARLDAEKANKAKGEFFAKMSHELRTPLNAIIGFSDIMKEEQLGALGNPQYRIYAQDIHDSSSHLLNIINDILDVSKAEAGKLELVEQNVSVISAVQSTMRMVWQKAESNNITLDASGIDPNMVLRVDNKKLRQILINLFSNAVKFTMPGGSITAFTDIDRAGNPAIHVRDTGIGMNEDDIPKALTAFSQVNNRLTQKHEGTGLGLPVCVALAELHGGKLNLQSAPGKGTTVSITFPAQRLVKIPASARPAAE